MFSATGLECVKGYDSLFSGLDLKIKQGEVMQIHGTNGSGKTSLLRILTGLSQPAAGEVFWNGVNIEDDPAAFNENLSYIGHLNGLKTELSALENLHLMQKYLTRSSNTQPQAALDAVGLAGYEHILTYQLSAGQKRRVALARLALCNTPLWILDEPTTAIDNEGVQAFEQTVIEHTNKGGMVILTAHQKLNFGATNLCSVNLSA